MRKPMIVKTLRYKSLLILGFGIGLVLVVTSAFFKLKGLPFVINALIHFILLIIVRYLCMGQFVAQELDNNIMTIKWKRKPLFSNESDFEFHLFDIAELKVFNDFLNHTPDEFYLKTNSANRLNFHIPILGFGNQYTRFYNVLNGAFQVSSNGLQKN